MKYHKAKEYLKNCYSLEEDEERMKKVKKIFIQHPSLINEDLNGAGWTALIFASIYGNKAMLKHLLSLPETNVNQQPLDGETALHHASASDDCETLRLLLYREDIDVNIQEQYGRTSLHLACYSGNVEAVTCLLSHRDINTNIEEHDGFLPRDICCNWSEDKSNQPILLDLLTNHSNSKTIRKPSDAFNKEYPQLKRQRLNPLMGEPGWREEADRVKGEVEEVRVSATASERESLILQIQDLQSRVKEIERGWKEERKERRKLEKRFEAWMKEMESRNEEGERKLLILEDKKR